MLNIFSPEVKQKIYLSNEREVLEIIPKGSILKKEIDQIHKDALWEPFDKRVEVELQMKDYRGMGIDKMTSIFENIFIKYRSYGFISWSIINYYSQNKDENLKVKKNHFFNHQSLWILL